MGAAVRVTFVPGDVAVEVASGVTLLEAAAHAGLVIPAPCGGRGACGRCAVRVEAGELAPPSSRERAALSRAKADPARVRLACMACVAGSPVTVRVRALTGGAYATSSASVTGRGRVVGAVDIGTTTVSALVLDPVTGARLGAATVGNRQSAWGADVLSRVSAALDGDASRLREAAEASMIEALECASEDAGSVAGFVRIVVAANTAMLSLLAGADVTGLASHPFVTDLSHPIVLHSTTLAEAFPGCEVTALAPVAAFVGGDLIAGMIAEGLAEGADRVAYLDIGTNAEVAVTVGDTAYVCSAPAGPAFEGWGIACGGLAGDGAIVAISADDAGRWEPQLVGDRATHLAGSGLVSAVAALRACGHLTPDGRLHTEGPLTARFFELGDGVLAFAATHDPSDRSVYVSQLDVRAFQYAKAAVCVGLRVCARAAGVGDSALTEYVVAGSFGGALREQDLVDLGVVPRSGLGRMRYAGEAALTGAGAVALEPGLFDVARRFSQRARHVDLAAEESFAELFVADTRLEPFSL